MEITRDFSKSLYRFTFVNTPPAAGAVLLLGYIFSSQTEVLKIFLPGLTALILFMLLNMICLASDRISNLLMEKAENYYPTMKLWLYPTIAYLFISLSSMILLKGSSYFLGRGFWSSFLGLTAQNTTSLFSATFFSMSAFVSLQFLAGIIRCLMWFISVSQNHFNKINLHLKSTADGARDEFDKAMEEIKSENDHFKELRIKAGKINRKALLFIVFLSFLAGIWVIFAKPEIILFYRAEIQLKSFTEPETAYKTFAHLLRKFPFYRYNDTVSFRMAWILDRRLNKPEQAVAEYERFLNKYGKTNVWSDEVTANLVRVYADKLNKPSQARQWAEKYLADYSNRAMTPHIYLYLIRSCKLLGDLQTASRIEKEASKKYQGHLIQIINSEDRLVERVPFSDALRVNNSFVK